MEKLETGLKDKIQNKTEGGDTGTNCFIVVNIFPILCGDVFCFWVFFQPLCLSFVAMNSYSIHRNLMYVAAKANLVHFKP